MNVIELQHEIEQLDEKEQKRLLGFMVGLQVRRDSAYREELTRRLDDRDPERWIPLEEMQRRLRS